MKATSSNSPAAPRQFIRWHILPDVMLIEVLVTAGLVAALVVGLPGWYGAALGVGLGAVLVTRVKGLPIRQWLALRMSFWGNRFQPDKRKGADASLVSGLDTPLTDESRMGLRWDGHTLVSVIAVRGNPHIITVMEPATTVSHQTVPLRLLTECLRQYDITLEAIDVVSRGVRVDGPGQVSAIYDAVVGPLPAVGQRDVWVVVRFDPARCPDAVECRGGGWDGTVRTAAAATERVAIRLTDAGLRPHILTLDELQAEYAELVGGTDSGELEERWSACREGTLTHRSYTMPRSMLTPRGLDHIWAARSLATTVCISVRHDHVERQNVVRGLVRMTHHGRAKAPPGLIAVHGRQHAALLCMVPLPAPRSEVGLWVPDRTGQIAETLVVPATACGQILGADEHGRAVALPLFGDGVSRVDLFGPLHFVQQVVLRSVALGARIRVHTHRVPEWRSMVDHIGDRAVLAAVDAAASVAEDRGGDPGTGYTVDLFDGVTEHEVSRGVTALVVRPARSSVAEPGGVTLQLLDDDQDLVRADTDAGSVILTMVASEDEMRYLMPSMAVHG